MRLTLFSIYCASLYEKKTLKTIDDPHGASACVMANAKLPLPKRERPVSKGISYILSISVEHCEAYYYKYLYSCLQVLLNLITQSPPSVYLVIENLSLNL